MLLAILIHDMTFDSIDERFVDFLSEKNGWLIYFQIQEVFARCSLKCKLLEVWYKISLLKEILYTRAVTNLFCQDIFCIMSTHIL